MYKPAQFDPAVVEFDEKTKSTVTATELTGPRLFLQQTLDVRVPTLLVDGELDSQVCKENFDAVPAVTGGGGGADCSSPEALIEDERAHLGPHVPSVDAFILPGAPHLLNQALNAREYFTAVNHWIAATLRN